MPISASFSLASNRRFATWTSSAILLPFNAHRSPCPCLPAPRHEPPARDLLWCDASEPPLPPPELRLGLPEIDGGGRAVARPPPQPGELRYIAGAASWMIRPNRAGSLSESSR